MARRAADFSPRDLVKAAEQLDPPELERLVADLLALVAHRKAPALARSEAELLLRINDSIPAEMQRRYTLLIERRQTEDLAPEEYEELLLLSEKIERLEAERVADLAALATLRKRSLPEVVADLAIDAPVRHG